MNEGEALSFGRSSLAGTSETPARDASLLLSYVLDRPLEHAYLHPEAEVSEESAARYRELIERRKRGEPIAYLRGVHEFMGLKFKIDSSVLVPRPETELIVEVALRLLSDQTRELFQPSPLIADICCGSGAIGISIARLNPSVYLYLADVSREAVALARENANWLGAGDRVSFFVGDLFSPLLDAGLAGKLDMVVTNPPYIPSDEIPELPRDVRDFEPRLALDGGYLGLDVISRIATEAPLALKPGGHLVMEIGADQDVACLDILDSTGLWQDTSVSRDLAGRQRVVVGRTRSAG